MEGLGRQSMQAGETICTVSHHDQLECLTTARTLRFRRVDKHQQLWLGVSPHEPDMTYLSPGGRSVSTTGAMDRDEQDVSRWCENRSLSGGRDCRRVRYRSLVHGSQAVKVVSLSTWFCKSPMPSAWNATPSAWQRPRQASI